MLVIVRQQQPDVIAAEMTTCVGDFIRQVGWVEPKRRAQQLRECPCEHGQLLRLLHESAVCPAATRRRSRARKLKSPCTGDQLAGTDRRGGDAYRESAWVQAEAECHGPSFTAYTGR